MNSNRSSRPGAGRLREPRRPARFLLAFLALVLVLGGVSAVVNPAVARADGRAGTWVDGTGLYVLSNAATGGSVEVACIDAGRLAPTNAVNTVKSSLTAPKMAYLLFKYTPGADATTRAALGHLGHVSKELPHNHKTTPAVPSARVAKRVDELVAEANKYAGPYTVTSKVTTVPTATSARSTVTVTVISKAGVGVPGVKVSFARTGAATGLGASSGTTNSAGRATVTYNLANKATGGVRTTALGLAGTAVTVYSAATQTSAHQRVIGKGAATSVASSAQATRPAVPNGSIRVGKVSKTATATFLAGAVIDIHRGSSTGPIVKTVTTKAAAGGVVVSLPPGTYVGVERKAPTNYLKDAPAVKVTVTSGTTKNLTLANSPKGKFSVVKVDAQSRARLAGVKFRAESGDTTLVTFTTDANGAYTSPFLPLAVGKKVRIVEIAPKAGYQPTAPRTVTLTKDGLGAGRVVVENSKIPRGRVSVAKSDARTGAALAGAKFKVVAQGVTIATGTTGADGTWTSPLLTTTLIGERVSVSETAAPDGYQLDPTPHQVTVTATGTGTARIAMTNIEIAHTRGIQILKTDEVTGASIPGTRFGLEVRKGGKGSWAKVSGGVTAGLHAGGVYTTAATGAMSGRIAVDGALSTPILEVGDEVRATEIAAAPGYLLSVQPATRSVVGTVGETDELRITAVNAPKRTIQVTKLSVAGKTLPGAGFVSCYQVGARDLADGERTAQVPCVVPAGAALTDQAGGRLDLTGWYSLGALAVTDAQGRTSTAPSDWVRVGDKVLVAETRPPTGFSLSTVAAVTTVTATGWDPECSNRPSRPAGTVFTGTVIACSLVDDPKTTIKITKSVVDAAGNPAPSVLPSGARYRITDAKGNLLAQTGPTGQDGTITLELEGLVDGQVLTFTEFDSPRGAALDTRPFTGKIVATPAGLLAVSVAQVDPVLAIGTTATDQASGGKTVQPGAKIRDVVAYSGLVPGKTYTLRATLQRLDAQGTVTPVGITGATEFVPQTSDGTVDVVLTLPTTIDPGVFVVFERLLLDGIVIATHEKPDSAEQTVYLPGVGTTAIGPDGDKFVLPGGTITDTIAYSGLVPGVAHTAVGELMTVTGGVATSTGIVAQIVFTPRTSFGTVKVTFTLPPDFAPGRQLVVFEDLKVAGKVIAAHRDATDEGQTVYVPDVRTTATDQSDGDKSVLPGGTVVDKITYSGLQAGKTYTLRGELMEIVGNTATATGIIGTATFVAAAPSGSVDVLFKIPLTFQPGRTLVAFETLSYLGRQIAIHADPKDLDQTVYVPKVATSAVDQSDGDKYLAPGGTVVDTITYSGLVPGVKTTATGELMLVVNGKATGTGITGSTVFTPATSAGSVKVTFRIPDDFVPGKTLVVFEELTVAGRFVAEHRDATDEGQTVYLPKIGTNATDQADGDKLVLPGGTVVDTVDYSGLVPGQQYTVSGELMSKVITVVAGKTVTVAVGTGILGSTTFTATAASGSVKVAFRLPTTIVPGNFVVYEDLLVKGKVIASHRVADSVEQSMKVIPTKPSG
ncbi:hypothetical protein D1871_12855 [Nakamurella silvestris]|nr:hypothetical protein D1871_12855 [Nakamurella silvestris]